MGRIFSEFQVGQRYVTPGRTITQSDVGAFAAITGDYNPVHTDAAFAASTEFGECIAHGPLGIGVAFGLASRLDLIDGTVIALLGVAWEFKAPVRFGDTIRAVIEVTGKRAVKDPDRGIVELGIRLVNDHNTVVQTGSAKLLMRQSRPAAANWGLMAEALATVD